MRTMFQMGFRPGFMSMGQDSSPWGPGGPPVTSIDQPTPTTPPKPAGSSDSTDWGKLISQGITAAAQGYGAYSKEQVAKIQAQAASLKPALPGAVPVASTGISANTMFLVGGLAVVGLIAAVALK